MGFLASIFGKTPSVPTYTPVDLGQSQAKSIASNTAALPGIESLVSSSNAFNQDQISKMLEKFAPGFGAASKQIGANANSELQGDIPTDVSDAIQKSSAAQALTGGFGGSGLSGNLLAKDLGLTSLDLMGIGTSTEESWTSMVDKMFAPGNMDVSSMFISPQQQFQADTTNNENKFNADWLKSQVEAQPSPVASGLFKAFTGTAALEAYGGGNPFGSGTMTSSGIGQGSDWSNGPSAWDGTTGAGASTDGALMAGGAGDAVGGGSSGLLSGLI
jgi:hypothetical protein